MTDFETLTPMPRPGLDPDAYEPLEDDEAPAVAFAPAPVVVPIKAPATLPPSVQTYAPDVLARIRRRREGVERPIPLPWADVSDNFNGGLWPGCHFLVSGSGVGKTTWGLQVALAAVDAGHPALYVGLELSEFEITARLAALRARLSWSSFLLGKLDERDEERAAEALAAPSMALFHAEFGAAHGWPYTRLAELAGAMRARYPEPSGPGSAPLLIIVDFAQLATAPPGSRMELREVVGRTAYSARQVARDFGAAVLMVSSSARDKYALIRAAVALADCDESGAINNPDAIIGLGKESGDVEFASDSVTVLSRGPFDGKGRLVAVATAKNRLGPQRWTALHFNGHRFSEPPDAALRGPDAMRGEILRLQRAELEAEQRKGKGKGKGNKAKAPAPSTSFAEEYD
jgi:hypothetical protein